MNRFDPFALGGWQPDPDDAPLSPAERRLIEGIKRLIPNYRFELSGFDKKPPARDTKQ